MTLPKSLKEITTNIPKKNIILTTIIILVIPFTVFAVSRRLELRKKAVGPTDSINAITDQLLRTASAYNLAAPSEKPKVLDDLVSVASQRKTMLLQEIDSAPEAFLGHTLSPDIRSRLPGELHDRDLIEREVEIKGELTVLFFDDFDAKQDWSVYKINNYSLHFTKTPPDIPSGSMVVVRGTALDLEVVLDLEVELSFEVITVEPPKTTGDFRMAILMFNFSNYRRELFTSEEIVGIAFTGSDSVRVFYEEVSYDQTFFSGDVFGWYELESTSDNCDAYFQAWAEEVRALATSAGVDLEAYDRVAYLFPFISNCSFGGIAGEDEIWVNGMNTSSRPDSSTFIHELGHTFGLAHSNLIKCGDKAIDEYTNCQVEEFWDRYDAMGLQKHHFNAAHKIKLNWIPPSRILNVNTSGNYKLYPLEVVGSGPQVLRIRKPNTNQYYYLEYRKPVGFDTYLPESIADNALIHIWSPSYPIINNVVGSFLIDTTPESDGGEALTDGSSFYDEINRITITQTGRNGEYVNIAVTIPLTPECSDGNTSPYPDVGKAAYFDGYSNIEISSPNNLIGRNNDDFTIEAWINPELRENALEYISARKSLETLRQTYRLLLHLSLQSQAADLRFTFGDVTSEGGFVRSDYLIPLGDWTHIGAVKEGNTLKIFINGQLAGSAPFININDSENGVNWIGGLKAPNQYVPLDAFKGFIDELRVSNVARNIEENWIGGVYSQPLRVDENTLALWRFEDLLEDDSDSGNDGLVFGNISFVKCGGCLSESLLPGDLDCDCDVDIVDIMRVCVVWNTHMGDEDFKPEYDFDADGDIDIIDIVHVADKWGTQCDGMK